MVQICFFCCFHQPLMQAHRKKDEGLLWKVLQKLFQLYQLFTRFMKRNTTTSFTTTQSRGAINFTLSLLLTCVSVLQLYSLEGIFTASYCQAYSHLLPPESLLNPRAILHITGHIQIETCPFRETTSRDLISFSINSSKNAMGKAFQTQPVVSISSKEKALWESWCGIVTETKTTTWFHKGLSDAVAIYTFLPFMEGNIIN